MARAFTVDDELLDGEITSLDADHSATDVHVAVRVTEPPAHPDGPLNRLRMIRNRTHGYPELSGTWDICRPCTF
jgi:hypothetical protein